MTPQNTFTIAPRDATFAFSVEFDEDFSKIKHTYFIKNSNAEFSREYPHENVTRVMRALEEYFNGKRRDFNDISSLLDLSKGTDFQKRVWEQLQRIEFGQTLTYAQMAEAIGKANAYRAVGNANGKNYIPLIVPCHRVVAKNGLGGFSSEVGVEVKQWLIDHEKKHASGE